MPRRNCCISFPKNWVPWPRDFRRSPFSLRPCIPFLDDDQLLRKALEALYQVAASVEGSPPELVSKHIADVKADTFHLKSVVDVPCGVQLIAFADAYVSTQRLVQIASATAAELQIPAALAIKDISDDLVLVGAHPAFLETCLVVEAALQGKTTPELSHGFWSYRSWRTLDSPSEVRSRALPAALGGHQGI